MSTKPKPSPIKRTGIKTLHERSSSSVEKTSEKAPSEPIKEATTEEIPAKSVKKKAVIPAESVKGGKRYKKKRVAEEAKPPKTDGVVVEALPDFFDHEDAGGKDKLAHDTEILIMEWAFFYPNHSPTAYLTDVKGYAETQKNHIFRVVAPGDWPARRQMAQDKLTGELIKRHVDTMAKVQDEHISASKLGLARAVQMLASGNTELIKKDGKVVLDAAGNPKFKQFRSVDLLNCMTAIEKAQNIYRRAMGLPNDEGGLQQILNKLERMREAPQVNFNLTQNTQINQSQTNVQVVPPTQPTDLGYDDIMLLIEAKREQKAKQAQAIDDRLKIEPREGVPTGDFTATPNTKVGNT